MSTGHHPTHGYIHRADKRLFGAVTFVRLSENWGLTKRVRRRLAPRMTMREVRQPYCIIPGRTRLQASVLPQEVRSKRQDTRNAARSAVTMSWVYYTLKLPPDEAIHGQRDCSTTV